MACGSFRVGGVVRGLPVLPRISSSARCTRTVVRSNSKQREAVSVGRRGAIELGVLGAIALGSNPLLDVARAAGLETYYGLASPPTSYGGYGGNAEESPKYSFSYPSNWKVAKVNKVQKGTQGIDCIINNPRSKEMRAFVISLGRAGEDNKSFRLTDVDSTIAGFAGADYDLQDALVASTDKKKSQREVEGDVYYDYDINSPNTRYLSTVTFKEGKVFALFIKSPTKQYDKMADVFKSMVESFRTL